MTTFEYKPLTIERARAMLFYAIEKQNKLAQDLNKLAAQAKLNQDCFSMVFEAVEAASNSLAIQQENENEHHA